MANVAAVDWTAKRIYLHSDTVTHGFDIIAAHFEIKALVAANENGEQFYGAPTSAEGNLPKGGGNFTPRFGLLAPGWRLVPYDGTSHELRLLTEIISEDGITDRDVFDRSTVPATVFVDVTPIYEKIEIREVNTGSGLTTEQANQLAAAASGADPEAIRIEMDANSTKLDVPVSSRLAAASYSAPPTPSAIAAAVWDGTQDRLRRIYAVLRGRAAVPSGPGMYEFRDEADAVVESGTIDAQGNRTPTP